MLSAVSVSGRAAAAACGRGCAVLHALLCAEPCAGPSLRSLPFYEAVLLKAGKLEPTPENAQAISALYRWASGRCGG